MIPKTLPILLVFLCHALLAFSNEKLIYQNSFEGTPIAAYKDDKKWIIKVNGKPIAEAKTKDDQETLTFLTNTVKTNLLTAKPLGDKVPKIVSFSAKFAENALKASKTPIEANVPLERKAFDEFELIKMYTNDQTYLYYLDKKGNQSDATNFLLTKGSGYEIDITAINSSSYKSSIITNLPAIIAFIKENKEIKVPEIKLVQTGDVYRLQVENDPKNPVSISISKEEADKIKGEQIETSKGTTTYKLKDSSQENTAKKTEATSEQPKEETIGTKDLVIANRTYATTLLKNKDQYYVKLCGPAVDIVDNGGKKEPKIIKQDSCLVSSDKISSLSENKAAFKQMVDNAVKKLNKEADTNNDAYSAQVEIAYTYFSGEVAKQQQSKKEADFVKQVIKESGLEALANEKQTFSKVGTIQLRNTTIPVYNNTGTTQTATVKSVRFSIGQGKLSKQLISVTTDKGTFFNKKVSIPLLKLRKRANDNLVSYDINNFDYIRVGGVLQYHNDGGFLPDDIDTVTLTADQPSKSLVASSDLNSILNFSLYTDLTGLLGRRPNGLLMTDVTGRFITNTGNFFGIDITPSSYIETNLTLARFDSKFRSLDSSFINTGKSGQRDTVDRMHLNQIAWLKGSLKWNLLSYTSTFNQSLQLNAGAQINVVNADSFYKKEKDIIFFGYYPELTYSIHRLRNFGMETSLKLMFQRIADSSPFQNKGWEKVLLPQISFFYYPSNNPTSKVYLRFNYWDNLDHSDNNFYQLQFGWRTGLKLSK